MSCFLDELGIYPKELKVFLICLPQLHLEVIDMRFGKMRLFTFSLIIAMTALLSFSVHAQEDKSKTVRVGWYESAFHSTDQFGRRSGYGYEYQQRIATYTGWTYEYVEGSWSELLEMLIAGDLDLLSDVSYTEERAEKILYSSEAMGSEGYHVFISPDNTQIRPDDFSTLNGKKVGVNKNSIQEELFVQWAGDHNVSPKIIESTEKTPVLLEMLDKGEFDALVTLDTYGNTANVIPVWKVGFADSYFGINKARPDLKQELDLAMSRLFEENRDFNQELTEKYNRSSAVNSFLTTEEKDWVTEHGIIRVGYRDDFLPYCDLDDDSGQLTGALADYLAFAQTCEKNAELCFETKAYPTTQDAIEALKSGEIDCMFPTHFSTYDGEQQGIIITDPFVETEIYAIVRIADRQGISPDRDMTVAVLEGHLNHETFLKDYFPNWKIIYTSSNDESMEAVSSGAADCTLVSNYRSNRISDLCSKYKLTFLSTGNELGLSFGIKREDDCLYSIINKIIRLMPDTLVNSSLTKYSFIDDKVTFAQYLRDNMIYFVAAAAIIAVIILLLVLRNLKSDEQVREGREIISEAERDPLTSLYNRNFFLIYSNRLYREDPEKEMDAVVINIDRFHSVNAIHGRDFGDQVLRGLGKEINAIANESEGIAGRFEADRFDIYCLHRDDWQTRLEQLQEKMDIMFHNASIHLRMGVKPWQKGLEPVFQFDRARTACNKARGDYKSQVVIYDAAMGHREERDQRLINDLSRALENCEFEVYYQPKYDIQCEEPLLSSAEALVRWNHPELGFIPPDEFIQLFEQSGQISSLDNYVWEQTVHQMAVWRDRYGKVLPVSVNLSRIDVFDPKLSATLDGLVARYGLSSHDLKLEVTESAYTENAEQLVKVIEELRGKGYEIEMDDFGSGYSSLNMLSSMPVDILKMDMAFIRNIERNEKDFRLVELIVDIAHYLKVPVIAEGVETERQLNLLKNAGCSLVQGYYFSRPLPADEFAKKILGAE